MGPKKILPAIGVIIVAGALYYLFELGGKDRLVALFKRPSIEVRCVNRRDTDKVYAGEKLRFFINNVKCNKVFWIFDERHVVPGGIELEYRFSFEEGEPTGIEADHRVDVLFRSGQEYSAATTMVRVVNLNLVATIHQQLKRIEFLVKMKPVESLQLRSIGLAQYTEGRFSGQAALPVYKEGSTFVDADGNSATKWVVNVPEANTRMIADWKGKSNAWTEFTFSDTKTGQELVLVERAESIKVEKPSNPSFK